MLKKGQKVVTVLRVMGTETVTIETVESVKRGIASIVDSSLKFDAKTLREHEPAGLMGCSCHLVPFDDGEEKRWRLQ